MAGEVVKPFVIRQPVESEEAVIELSEFLTGVQSVMPNGDQVMIEAIRSRDAIKIQMTRHRADNGRKFWTFILLDPEFAGRFMEVLRRAIDDLD